MGSIKSYESSNYLVFTLLRKFFMDMIDKSLISWDPLTIIFLQIDSDSALNSYQDTYLLKILYL